MTDLPFSGESTAVEDFRAQLQSARNAPKTHDRAFVLVNVAAAPGDIMVAIHSRQVNDAQMPMFGPLPLRMSRYFDKEATDYKKRLLSNCKSPTFLLI